jgi:hypothetical protein
MRDKSLIIKQDFPNHNDLGNAMNQTGGNSFFYFQKNIQDLKTICSTLLNSNLYLNECLEWLPDSYLMPS